MSNEEPTPTFKGIQLAGYTPCLAVGLLDGDFGKEVFEEYLISRRGYKCTSTQAFYTPEWAKAKRVVNRVNPFSLAAINDLPLMTTSGLHVATQADLELMLRAGDPLKITNNYKITTGLVLKSEDGPNCYLAHILAADIKKKTKQEPPYPLLLNIGDVRVEADEKSPYGLVFRLKDATQLISSPILNKPGYFSSRDIDAKTGLPTETVAEKTEEKNRRLYTSEHGLSGLFLDWGLDLYAWVEDLAFWSTDNRVVVRPYGAQTGGLSISDVSGVNGALSHAKEEGGLTIIRQEQQ